MIFGKYTLIKSLDGLQYVTQEFVLVYYVDTIWTIKWIFHVINQVIQIIVMDECWFILFAITSAIGERYPLFIILYITPPYFSGIDHRSQVIP